MGAGVPVGVWGAGAGGEAGVGGAGGGIRSMNRVGAAGLTVAGVEGAAAHVGVSGHG